MRSLASFVAGRRSKWLPLATWLALLVVIAPLAGRLWSITNDDTVSYLPSGSDSAEVERIVQRLSGEESNSRAAVIYSRDGGLGGADLDRVRRDMAEMDDRYVRAGPVVPSQDGDAAVYTVHLPPSEEGAEGDAAVRHVEDIRAALDPPAGLDVQVGGPAGILADQLTTFEGLDSTVLYATVGVVAVMLLVVYRSPVLWLVPLVISSVATMLGQALVYLAAPVLDLTITSFATFLLVVLVYGAGTDYSLLLVARYREELRRYPDRHRAMRTALRRSLPACLASACTTGLALLCLLAADLTPTRALGPVGFIGIACALLISFTLLPAILVIFGRWVFWPSVPRPGLGATQRVGVWRRVGGLIDRGPRRAWMVTALALCVCLGGFTLLDTRISEIDTMRTRPDSLRGQEQLLRHYPPGISRTTVVVGSAAAGEDLLTAAHAAPGVTNAANVDEADGQVRIDVRFDAEPDSAEEARYITALRENVRTVPGGDARVGGHSAINLDTSETNVRDAAVVIPLVLVVVVAVLVLLLRSVVASLVIAAASVLSYLAAVGVSLVCFRVVFGFPTLDPAILLPTFVLLVGLGVDYSVFLMTRAREESARRDTRAGVLDSLGATGGVVTSAGLILVATFAVIISLPLVQWIQIGVVAATGILLDTLVVRTLLVPAVAVDLGERVWWPARRRLHRPEYPEISPAGNVPARGRQ